MKFSISRLFQRKEKAGISTSVSPRGGWYPWVQEPYMGAWQKNDELRTEDYLATPIVYACVTLIANDIGKLRARLVTKDADGIWSEVDGNSPFWPVLRRPNRYQNHIQFKQWWATSKLRFGNTFALKERDQRGIVTALYILDPCRVTPLVTEDGGVYYQLSQDSLNGVVSTGVVVPASEIIHDRMNCLFHPLMGVPPLYAAAIAAGIGIKIQKNAAYFFGNSSNPSGILIIPGSIDRNKAAEVKSIWEDGYSGANSGRVAVLADGVKFEAMSQKATDSQLIETLRWSDERICSVFHVPGYKVGVGSAPSYNNIEALDRAYYSDCLQSPIEEFEACMDEGLGLDGYTKGVELDLDGLLRMDSKTQMETIGAGIGAKVLTIDNGRKRLNLPPIVGGDTVYMQQQDYPISEIRNNKLAAPGPAVQPVAEPSTTNQEDDTPDVSEEAMKALVDRVDGLEQSVSDSVTLTIKTLFAEADARTESQAKAVHLVEEDIQIKDFTLEVMKHFAEPVDA